MGSEILIKSNKLVLGRGRILSWARERKVIKTPQSLSFKRSSSSKQDMCTENYTRRRTGQGNKHQTITREPWPVDLEKKRVQKLICGAGTRWYPLWPEQVRTTSLWRCWGWPFRLGSRGGRTQDHLSFFLKPCYLSELSSFFSLLGILLNLRQIWPKSLHFSCVYMAQWGGEFGQTPN